MNYSALTWLIALGLLLLVLFLAAWLKPVLFRKGLPRKEPSKKSAPKHALRLIDDTDPTLQKLLNILRPSLTDHTLQYKANRVLISKNGKQLAIVTIDDTAVWSRRKLDDVLIFSVPSDFSVRQIETIIDEIRAIQ